MYPKAFLFHDKWTLQQKFELKEVVYLIDKRNYLTKVEKKITMRSAMKTFYNVPIGVGRYWVWMMEVFHID